MSRFFKAANVYDSDSSSTSSEEEDFIESSDSGDHLSDEEDDNVVKVASGAARFMKGAASSDDESSDQDVRRLVKSTRDKRFEDMRSIVKGISNGQKNGDWVMIQNEFDKLVKALSKAASIIAREKVPRFVIRCLVHLDDHIKNFVQKKELIKKLNPSSAKAFNAMKQKVRKIEKTYEKDMAGFKAAPVNEDESASEAERAAEGISDDSDREDSDAETLKQKKVQFTKQVAAAEVEDDSGFTIVGKGGKLIDVSKHNLLDRLAELLEERGKKSTDKMLLIQNIGGLLKISASPYQSLKVLLALIPARFDYTSSAGGYTPIDIWKCALEELNNLFDILERFPNASVGYLEEDLDQKETVLEKKFMNNEPIIIQGHLGSFIDRLDDEFIKSLQNIDPHTSEYVERLSDETLLYSLILRAQKYFEKKGGSQDLVDMTIMRRVEHIYFKSDELVRIIEETVGSTEDPSKLVSSLCIVLYKTGIDRIRTRALLCHVYHLALHDQFYEARDILLMSHLQENISMTDIQTQIMYNRTMVQLGLSAFRCGLILDSCNALQDIFSSGRIRELLAQGIQTGREKTVEQEKLEKSRQMPFHMHINLELIECVYLVSAMLLEISNMALSSIDGRRKVIAKPFRKLYDYSERQSFCGPPENTKDHIMAASRAIALGEWEQARDLILSIKIWNMMPQSDSIKKNLTRRIQEESLSTFVVNSSPFCDSLSIADLSSMFSLDSKSVIQILSRMILNEQLFGYLDEAEEFITMDSSKYNNGLETVSISLIDKIINFADTNQKLAESRLNMDTNIPGNNLVRPPLR